VSCADDLRPLGVIAVNGGGPGVAHVHYHAPISIMLAMVADQIAPNRSHPNSILWYIMAILLLGYAKSTIWTPVSILLVVALQSSRTGSGIGS